MEQAETQDKPLKVTDIDDAIQNIDHAVYAFAERWISLPQFEIPCEVMDQGQLRDAMGLRATIDVGDPWPHAEATLMKMGFRWHSLGNCRVMYLRERDDIIEDDGWAVADEV